MKWPVLYKKSPWDFKENYDLNLKRAVVVTLFSLIIIIYLSPRVDVEMQPPEPPQITISVENIPVTRQSFHLPPPPKPTVPIPSEDEAIPEDETIEETTLKYTNFFDNIPHEITGMPSQTIVPPRPIAWVFPEYPEEEKKKGVRGVVKISLHIDEHGKVIEAVVLENTTGSQKCEKAALEAAYGSRFYPAREGNKPVSYWLTQPYRFDYTD